MTSLSACGVVGNKRLRPEPDCYRITEQERMIMKMEELLRVAVEKQAADIFLIPGMPLSYRVGGRIINHDENKIFPQEMDTLIEEFYMLAGNRDMSRAKSMGMTISPWRYRGCPGFVPMYFAREGHWLLLSA